MISSNITFGAMFNTREIANILSGKEAGSREFLSKMTEIPIEKLIAYNNSDTFSIGTNICKHEIIKQYPDLKPLTDISTVISDRISKFFAGNKKQYNKIIELFNLRDKTISDICTKYGDSIDIKPINIPSLKK